MSRLWSSLIEVSSSIEKKEKKAKKFCLGCGLALRLHLVLEKKQKKNFEVFKMSMMCFSYKRLHKVLKKKILNGSHT